VLGTGKFFLKSQIFACQKCEAPNPFMFARSSARKDLTQLEKFCRAKRTSLPCQSINCIPKFFFRTDLTRAEKFSCAKRTSLLCQSANYTSKRFLQIFQKIFFFSSSSSKGEEVESSCNEISTALLASTTNTNFLMHLLSLRPVLGPYSTPANTKGGSITVLLTSCLTHLD